MTVNSAGDPGSARARVLFAAARRKPSRIVLPRTNDLVVQ